MSAPARNASPILRAGEIPPLEPGDRLTWAEFERRYDAMPNLKKAELIEGVVYMPSAVRQRSHGQPHAQILAWLIVYGAWTPGVSAGDNSTLRLDDENAPQPDALLFINTFRLGQARIDDDDYIEGAPELVAEVSSSSVSFDLHTKLNVYRRFGVREYIVWRVLDGEIDWFVLRRGRFQRLKTDTQGLLKSRVFPGLWLDTAALVGGDVARVIAIVQQGVGAQEHANFVARLAAAGPRP